MVYSHGGLRPILNPNTAEYTLHFEQARQPLAAPLRPNPCWTPVLYGSVEILQGENQRIERPDTAGERDIELCNEQDCLYNPQAFPFVRAASSAKRPSLVRNPMKHAPPSIIAHRGGAGLWPENTLGAFENAIKLGAHGIELDIQSLQDGTLVVYHDDRLRPSHAQKNGAWLTAPTPRICTLSPEDLSGIDVGHDRDRADEPDFCPIPNSAIPSFTEVLALIDRLAPPSFQLFAELKTNMIDADEAVKLAESFCDCLENWKSKDKIQAQITIVSFDWRCLDYVRTRFPKIRHGYTTLPFDQTNPEARSAGAKSAQIEAIRAASAAGAPWWHGHDWRKFEGSSHGAAVLNAMKNAKARGWCAYGGDLSPPHIKHANALDLEIYAWTINAPDQAQRLAQQGVTALITDRPDLLLTSLGR